MAVDIVAFGEKYRDVDAQALARRMLYEHLIEAFAITGLPWWDCYRQDRGDGAFVVAPPDVGVDRFLDPLPRRLAAILGRYNRLASQTTPLRLRMAVHRGYVRYDAHGVTGSATTHLFRLLDAAAFKKALVAAGTDLGMIVSQKVYADAARRGQISSHPRYRKIHVTCKETRANAWLWLPCEGSTTVRSG
jgi:class 3 adenylate cyclase